MIVVDEYNEGRDGCKSRPLLSLCNLGGGALCLICIIVLGAAGKLATTSMGCPSTWFNLPN